MGLIIGFQPGDALSIGDKKFGLNVAVRLLLSEDGAAFALTREAVSLLPDLVVHVAEIKTRSDLTLAFEAPPDTRITRIRREDTP